MYVDASSQFISFWFDFKQRQMLLSLSVCASASCLATENVGGSHRRVPEFICPESYVGS